MPHLGDDMSLSKLSPKRQIVVPQDICEAIGAEAGDYIEFVKTDRNIVIKAKKLVDKPKNGARGLPPAPSYEERMRLMKLLEGNREDDSEDIPIEKVIAARVNKDIQITFDE
ncbi:MAG: hypothetical protein FD122_3499 [Stygiobacter sp.]|nr:MAG: hypothetical protein FD122_3499 [Stygiobacter sp.]